MLGSRCYSLPGAGLHTVEIWNGPQVLLDGTVYGTTVGAIWLMNASFEPVAPVTAPPNRLVILGDSITADGFYASTVAKTGAGSLYRNEVRDDLAITFVGWGNASLHAMCTSTYASCAAFAQAVAALATDVQSGGDEVILLALGTNDYLLPTESASGYQSDVEAFATALHAAAPNAILEGHGMTSMSGTREATANAFANVPNDYRAAMATAFSAIDESWARYANYQGVIDPSTDLYVDGLHPNDTGHQKIAAQYDGDFGF